MQVSLTLEQAGDYRPGELNAGLESMKISFLLVPKKSSSVSALVDCILLVGASFQVS